MELLNKAGLAIVFRNSEPRREPQYPGTWLLHTSKGQVDVFVSREDSRRPRILRKIGA